MHPALKYNFHTLLSNLRFEVARGSVTEKVSDDGLSLFTYTRECQFENHWNDYNILARGLILDTKNARIAALSFPKFFNYGEKSTSIPLGTFEVTEKMDGSLIIIYFHNGEWKTATKGSFNSDQAVWAKNYLSTLDMSSVDKNTTLLAEAIYPENKIVINYPFEGLVLLGAYTDYGQELEYNELVPVADSMGIVLVNKFCYSFDQLLEFMKTLPASEEGFVVKFQDGTRLKFKGDEYCRLHRLISNCTPLAIWDMMRYDKDLVEVKKELPEEFYTDFDSIVGLLNDKLNLYLEAIENAHKLTQHLSSKEVAYEKDTLNPLAKDFIFSRRNGQLLTLKLDPKIGCIAPSPRRSLFEMIKPKANILIGYKQSSSINKILKESE